MAKITLKDKRPTYDTRQGVALEPYIGKFQDAFSRELGQGARAVDPRSALSGAAQMQQAFEAEFHNATGKWPGPDETRAFLDQNITPVYAMKVLSGQGGAGDATTAARQYIQTNPDVVSNSMPDATPDTSTGDEALRAHMDEESKRLNDELNTLYNKAYEGGAGKIKAAFGDERRRMNESLIARNVFDSPVSAIPEAELGGKEATALGEFGGNLALNRASGDMDMTKFIESLAAGERRASEAGGQFQQQFGLAEDKLNMDKYNLKQTADQNYLDSILGYQLGEKQAGAYAKANEPQDPTTYDWLKLGVGLVNPLVTLGTHDWSGSNKTPTDKKPHH